VEGCTLPSIILNIKMLKSTTLNGKYINEIRYSLAEYF
jgi:hypothetical protein